MDKRIGSIGKEINVDRLMKLIDKKMSKEEGQMKFDMVELKVNRAEKMIKTCDGNVNRFEVSCFIITRCSPWSRTWLWRLRMLRLKLMKLLSSSL